jgi:hypothetical protein
METANADQFKNYIRPVQTILPARIKNEVLLLDCSIIDHFPNPLPMVIIEPITVFLLSVIDCLRLNNELVKQKFFFVCSIMNVMRKLY